MTINARTGSDSLSVNGFMTDCFSTNMMIPASRSAVFDVQIRSSALEDNNIDGLDAITDVEMTISIRDSDYNDIASPVISISHAA